MMKLSAGCLQKNRISTAAESVHGQRKILVHAFI